MWHWGENSLEGSEHYLNGVQQPMEIQLFHWNTKYSDYITASQNADGLSAVSFFYELSATNNSAIAKQLDVLSDLINSSPLYQLVGTGLEAASAFYPEFEQPFPVTSLSQLLPDGGVAVSDNYFHYKGSQTLPRTPYSPTFSTKDHTVNGTTLNGELCCDCQDPSQSEITVGTLTCACCDKSTATTITDCTESVTWIVYEKKIAISEAQLNVYRGLLSTVNFKGPTYLSNYDHTFKGANWHGIPCCDCQNDSTIEAVVGTVTCRCCKDLMCSKNFRPLHPLNPTTLGRKLMNFIVFWFFVDNLIGVI